MDGQRKCWCTARGRRAPSPLTIHSSLLITSSRASLCSLVAPWGTSCLRSVSATFLLIDPCDSTCSYVLTGTERGMVESFGSTCHGAGRALSRNKSRKTKGYEEVLKELADKGISIRVASPKLVTEEAPEAYKDVTEVVDTCHAAGISKKAVKLRPIAVIKG